MTISSNVFVVLDQHSSQGRLNPDNAIIIGANCLSGTVPKLEALSRARTELAFWLKCPGIST